MVAFCVILAGVANGGHGADYQNVAYDGHHGGGSGGSQSKWTYLLRVASVETDVCGLSELAVFSSGDDNEFDVGAESAGQFYQINNLIGLARVGDEQHYIVWLQYAQIAMLSF